MEISPHSIAKRRQWLKSAIRVHICMQVLECAHACTHMFVMNKWKIPYKRKNIRAIWRTFKSVVRIPNDKCILPLPHLYKQLFVSALFNAMLCFWCVNHSCARLEYECCDDKSFKIQISILLLSVYIRWDSVQRTSTSKQNDACHS